MDEQIKGVLSMGLRCIVGMKAVDLFTPKQGTVEMKGGICKVAETTHVNLSRLDLKTMNISGLKCVSRHKYLCGLQEGLGSSVPLSCIDCNTRLVGNDNEEDDYISP